MSETAKLGSRGTAWPAMYGEVLTHTLPFIRRLGRCDFYVAAGVTGAQATRRLNPARRMHVRGGSWTLPRSAWRMNAVMKRRETAIIPPAKDARAR